MSYLENNMNLLKTSYPEVWEKISAVEKTLNQDLLQLIRNKKGMLKLRVGQMLIHDKNNPHQEAKAFIQSQKNIEEHSDILFYGIGLGYAIQAFNQEYPHKPFSVYEPIPEIFYHFLAHTDLAKFPRHILKKIYIETQPEDVEGFCSTYAKTIGYSGMLIEHPNYARIFPEKRQNFIKVFEKHIRERSASINTLSAFEKLWTSNSTKNMIEILNSPNILLKNKDHFLQQPAIMVASGPSLEDEIENLHKIKSEGLAYIFSVGTALNALIRNGIYPHAAFTYDPSEKNLIICKEVIEKGIDSIPLIFGSTVYHQTLAQYPGPKMHMLISQDTLAAYYLKPKNSDQIETIHDATTIAVITLQVLAKLGFSPIILVGQNLAYRDKKVYAANATFHPREASEQILNNAVWIKDVNGNPLPSSHAFNRMRQQFEFYLSHNPLLKVINTTKQGAHIEGTTYQDLDDVIEKQLQERVVPEDWLKDDTPSYDMDYLIKQKKAMQNAYEKILDLLTTCKKKLDIINELATCGDPVMISQSYEQFNRSMDELRNNHFFSTFINPMNRVELEMLTLAVPSISAEREPIRKARMMEDTFRPYLLHCEEDIKAIAPHFHEMNEELQYQYVREKAAHIKVLLLEGDGVLTDGSIYYNEQGQAYKKFHYLDRIAARRLLKKGISIILINPDNDPVIKHAAREFLINTGYTNLNKNQLMETLQNEGLQPEAMAGIVRDKNDWPYYQKLGLSLALKNNCRELESRVDYVLDINGGQGVIQAIADLIIGD
jgi:YrbI family 3-deoxy-D-manno-octulosonate 8-phosphate phosphatase